MYLSSLPRKDPQELLSVTCTFTFHKTKDDKLSKKKKVVCLVATSINSAL